MKIPPSIVRLRVSPPFGFLPTLFLPVFLLWLLVLLVLVMLLPLLVLGALVLFAIDARSAARWFAFLSGIYALICALRGVHVDVRGSHAQVLVSVI